MKKQLLFILFVLFSLPVLAHKPFPPAFDVAKLKDSTNVKLPSKYWQVYSIGGDTTLTIDQVTTRPYADKFDYSSYSDYGTQPKNIDWPVLLENLNAKSQWVRLRLTNSSAQVKKVFLSCSGGENIYYVYQNKKRYTYKNGFRVVWDERDGDRNNKKIHITVNPGEQVIVFYNATLSVTVPIIEDYDAAIKDMYHEKLNFDEDFVLSFGFAGFIAFALIFNLLFYYINREKLYLNYSIMLFFLALLSAGDTIVFLCFPGLMPYQIEIFIFLLGGFFISIINTLLMFLNVKKYYPKWSIFFKYFTIVFWVSTFILSYLIFEARYVTEKGETFIGIFITFFMVFGIGFMVAMVAFVIIIIKSLIKLKEQKDPEAQIIFWSLLPFLVTFMPGVPSYKLLTAMWGVVYLSWGMFARFKRLQEQYVAQELEKERITREKEEERNALIAQQNIRLEQLVEERTAELEQSLENLKDTQNQLIQSEKMASLGELTAGIAHEIQNPLNFVNNFGDVSVELIEEMEEELQKGDTDEAIAIAGDIKQNLEKIVHHGRRADSIVKGMLQHSRASSGQKEPTDINALADEYFRLAYHGLRAKDKSFNAELVTSFDANLPKVAVMPQDMGRVLLNLFTNAFYATQQKVKQYSVNNGQTQPTDDGYKPTVTVTTKRVDDAVEITVKDNGIGIPDAIKDKILQPFFTTKPTGEGTGLGLSLSYDVVVKAHGGSIEIDSVEGEYTVFVIRIAV